jgi:hypothetical protein
MYLRKMLSLINRLDRWIKPSIGGLGCVFIAWMIISYTLIPNFKAIGQARQEYKKHEAALNQLRFDPKAGNVIYSNQLTSVYQSEDTMKNILPGPPLQLTTFRNIETKRVENLYQYTLSISFTGTYLQTLNYLKNLTEKHDNIFWGSIDYSVISYPKAQITMTIVLLSKHSSLIHSGSMAPKKEPKPEDTVEE